MDGTKGIGGRKWGDKTKISKSVKAGFRFLVGRIGWYLKKGRYVKRTVVGALIYLATVLKYLVAEVLELVGNAACDKKNKIHLRFFLLAMRSSKNFLQVVNIASIGVLPIKYRFPRMIYVFFINIVARTRLLLGIRDEVHCRCLNYKEIYWNKSCLWRFGQTQRVWPRLRAHHRKIGNIISRRYNLPYSNRREQKKYYAWQTTRCKCISIRCR